MVTRLRFLVNSIFYLQVKRLFINGSINLNVEGAAVQNGKKKENSMNTFHKDNIKFEINFF